MQERYASTSEMFRAVFRLSLVLRDYLNRLRNRMRHFNNSSGMYHTDALKNMSALLIVKFEHFFYCSQMENDLNISLLKNSKFAESLLNS